MKTFHCTFPILLNTGPGENKREVMLVLPHVFAKDVMALLYIMENIGLETTKIPGKHCVGGAVCPEVCWLEGGSVRTCYRWTVHQLLH